MRQELLLKMVLGTAGLIFVALVYPMVVFTAWSSLAHAALMGTQVWRGMVAGGEGIGVAVLAIIGVALLALAPGRPGLNAASQRVNSELAEGKPASKIV